MTIKELLNKHRLKCTPRRVLLLQIFEEEKIALSVEDLYTRMNARIQRLGLPGIYRNLKELEDIGILVRVQTSDRKTLYALCDFAQQDETCHDHHHHLICSRCFRVEDLPECELVLPSMIKGYHIQNHQFQVEGLCPNCQHA